MEERLILSAGMRIFAGIVILIYVFSLSKPVQTILHFTQNQEQIAEELCENKDQEELECNGKCYLMKELANEVNDDQALNSEENSKPSKKDSKSQFKQKDYERLNNPVDLPIYFLEKDEKNFIPYSYHLATFTGDITVPPPQVLYI
ncbi:hypothetical protein SAMN05216474_0290 [Lishizhenia tianjinensis]|uniref:Uncharacterized protein n=1 Tax=Lishizhenia tianjinensis TaxID=477690 RepID=A0A1I6XL46_9FLAO|nr:hypothetical protein [Lishizhenia tianjinensis]SFT39069.1 hypothetical protein SAMN05216474_0290 [Lishizhenia tianjinensis]